jgi:hypothetical protein
MTRHSLETAFAPAERADPEALQDHHERLRADPLVRELLDSVPDWVVILNRQRQIVLANDSFTRLVGRPEHALLGMRIGEALDCIHAGLDACGTTEFCRMCGAVNAVLASQLTGRPDVKECRLTRRLGPDEAALDCRVWATPLVLGGEPVTVFAVRDITDEKRRQVLERIFFHDLINSAGGLLGILDNWDAFSGDAAAEMRQLACGLAEQIVEEIQGQRSLTAAECGDLTVEPSSVEVVGFLEQLCAQHRRYPAAHGKHLALAPAEGPTRITTDAVLLRRVLGNLVKNALEASAAGQTVTVSYRHAGQPTFAVHNVAAMPEAVRLQMFQRSFSTKPGGGRGIGSYSVKLLTERYLKGRVDFVTGAEEGTTFFVRLPANLTRV